MTDLDMSRLQELANTRKKIAEKQSRLIELQPINQDIELEKVKKALEDDTIYNPVFQYRTPDNDRNFLEEIQRFMNALRPDSSTLQGKLESALWDVGLEMYLQEQARILKKSHQLTASSIYVDSLPTKELFDKAWAFLKENPAHSSGDFVDEARLPAQRLMIYYQKFLQQFGFDDWQVIVTRDIASSAVIDRTPYKRIRLLTDHLFTPAEFANMIARNVVTGIGRAENGEMNDIASLMFNGFASYQATEFGLRKYLVEKVSGMKEIERLRQTTARYVAVYIALNGSFFDVVKTIHKYIGIEQSLEIATRVKRGLINTENPGGYLKDVLYWRGYNEVSTHLEENPEDLRILYTGKIGINDIPLVKELIEAEYVKLPEKNPEDMMQFARIMVDEMKNTIESSKQNPS